MSISDTSLSFEESPTIIDRLAVDSGCSMTGGLETLGRAYAMLRRSCTSCRASIRSVPGSKTRRTDESPGSDLELMVSSHAVLARISSRLTVTSSSTSVAESPRASAWISTMVGLNSGRTSTGASRSRETPKTISAAASTTTRERNCKLNASICRSMAGFLIGQSRQPAEVPRPTRGGSSPEDRKLKFPCAGLDLFRGTLRWTQAAPGLHHPSQADDPGEPQCAEQQWT
jgi:hypothetical protein